MYDRKQPMNPQQKSNCISMLQGCINRICVSDDPFEIVSLVSGANKYLADLSCNSLCRIRDKKQEVSE